MNPNAVLSLVLPFFICATLIMVLRKHAGSIGLLDRPCQRKQHKGLVPLVGGIAIWTAFAISTLLMFFDWSTLAMVSIGLLVMALGVLDDVHELGTRKRFLVQILAGVAMVYLGQLQINQLGNAFGGGIVQFSGAFAILFTIFSTVGVINALNMIDGMDGLAGSIASISFLALAAVAYAGGDMVSAQILLTIVGSLAAFLLFNLRVAGHAARIFMGDAGSMFLGFLLAWFFVALSQGESPVLSAVSAGWIFGLPLLDISVVMVRRVMAGRSPFAAGRDHLHHLLLDRGLSVNSTLAIIVAAHAMFVVIGLIGNHNRALEPGLFWLFIGLVVAHLLLSNHYTSIGTDARRQAARPNPRVPEDCTHLSHAQPSHKSKRI